ncbi:MAG: transposase [Chloroflexi bacterium]|nr:transposase [Chloroflexota bacterium]
MTETYGWLRPKFLVADRGFDSQQNHRFLIGRDIVPIIHIRKPTGGASLHDGIYSTKGAPTCLGGKVMTYIETDADTGKHRYACPVGGCEKFRSGKRNIIVRCQDSHWEDPADNPRVIGIIPRVSDEWDWLYAMRTGLERAFGSMKRSRLLDKHQYVTMLKVRAHVGMSMLTYAATMYGRASARDSGKIRHMRIKV